MVAIILLIRQLMLINLLAHVETSRQSQSRYLPSEYLTDVARIHHETARIDSGLYLDAVEEVCRLRVVSVDFLRRHFKLAYPQAMRVIQRMEDDGIIRRTGHRGRDHREGWRYEVI